MIPSVFSVGVSPASVNVVFSPNLEQDIEFRFRNNMGQDMNILLRLEGEFSKYATLDSDKIFVADGGYGFTTVHLKLPEKPEKAGWNTIWLVATEAEVRGGGSVGAKGEVKVPINIFSQYPGKYVEVILDAKDAKIGEDAEFEVTVKNLGTENISSVKATIEIYNGKKKLDEVKTDEKPLNVLESVKLYAKWPTRGQEPGKYFAKAIVDYDGNTAYANDTFRIGQLYIAITNFTKNAIAGTINKFLVEIESNWNDDVENVYADVFVFKNGEKKSQFKTISEKVSKFEKKNLTGYLDASNIDVGIYDLSIVLNYEGLTTNASGLLNVSGERLPEVELPTAERPSGFGKYLTATNLLILIIILLVLMNIWLYKRRKRENEAKQNQGQQIQSKEGEKKPI